MRFLAGEVGASCASRGSSSACARLGAAPPRGRARRFSMPRRCSIAARGGLLVAQRLKRSAASASRARRLGRRPRSRWRARAERRRQRGLGAARPGACGAAAQRRCSSAPSARGSRRRSRGSAPPGGPGASAPASCVELAEHVVEALEVGSRPPSAAARPRGGGCAGRRCRRPPPGCAGGPAAWRRSARRSGPGAPAPASWRRSRRRRTAAARRGRAPRGR